MKKTILILTLVLLLCGCAAPEAAGEGYTFNDDLGRTVTVSSCERTAPLLGSFAHIWHLAGGEVHASADDAWEDFDIPMPDTAVNLGKTKEPSLELLLAAQPDFVLASVNTAQQLQWKETLEAAGITVAYFDVSDFDDYLRLLKICTDLTGREDLYQQNGVAVQAQIDAVLETARQRTEEQGAPTVLSCRASASYIRAKNSRGNVMGQMLKALGCVNIADSEESLLENLSVEAIVKADPDFIFFVQTGDDPEGTEVYLRRFFEENPLWQQLTAVQEGRVYIMEKQLYNMKPNHRWGEAYEILEAILAQ